MFVWSIVGRWFSQGLFVCFENGEDSIVSTKPEEVELGPLRAGLQFFTVAALIQL